MGIWSVGWDRRVSGRSGEIRGRLVRRLGPGWEQGGVVVGVSRGFVYIRLEVVFNFAGQWIVSGGLVEAVPPIPPGDRGCVCVVLQDFLSAFHQYTEECDFTALDLCQTLLGLHFQFLDLLFPAGGLSFTVRLERGPYLMIFLDPAGRERRQQGLTDRTVFETIEWWWVRWVEHGLFLDRYNRTIQGSTGGDFSVVEKTI